VERTGRPWSFYHYVYGEGRRAEVRFDLGYAAGATPRTHRHAAQVVVRGAEPDAVDAWAEGLPERLADVDCLLVGVVRYADATELLLQVEDRAAFARAEPRLGAPGALTIAWSAGWDCFTDRYCPREADWQRISDREAVERLVAGGHPPEAEVGVEHRVVGDPAGLEGLAAELVPAGFEPAAVTDRLLRVVRRQRLDAVSDGSVPLAARCRRLGLVYDGWSLVR
jgi:hypothetical protein